MTKYNASNRGWTKIVGDISAEDIVINVEDTSRLPDVPFLLVIELDEIVEVTEVEGNQLTVVRGKEDTQAKAFKSGAIVENNFTAGMYTGLVHKDDIPVRITDDDTFEYRNNAGEWVELKGGGSSIKVGNVSDLSAEAKAGLVNEISWKDPADIEVDGVKIATWAGTQLRGKIGSYPIDEKDGELLADNTTRDKYADTPFEHVGLTDGDKWHYMLFPYTEDGVFTVDSANRVNATAIVKYTQDPPSAPEVTDITHDKATIAGGDVVSLDKTDWFDSPHEFTGLAEETEYTAYAKYSETDTRYESEVSDGKSFTTPSEAPGPSKLIAGNEDAGFYGEVPASDLITGDSLASKLGLTSGTSQFSNEPWLKFAYEGKIQYVAKKTFRYGLSWDQIDNIDAVYGDKTIKIDDKDYKIRLMRGANEDPASSASGSVNHGSEWNRLMLPAHERSIDKSWNYKDNAESDVDSWAHSLGSGKQDMYTDKDLHTHNNYGDGAYAWCQETYSTSTRLYRGHNGVSYSNHASSSNTSALRGWRPVLELL